MEINGTHLLKLVKAPKAFRLRLKQNSHFVRGKDITGAYISIDEAKEFISDLGIDDCLFEAFQSRLQQLSGWVREK